MLTDEMLNRVIDTVISGILGSHEVQEMLCINRQRLNVIVKNGKLKPIKELKNEKLFYKPDVEKLMQEMLLDSRTNLYKKMKG
jgi:predicted site-specific integrase-resolvase